MDGLNESAGLLMGPFDEHSSVPVTGLDGGVERGNGGLIFRVKLTDKHPGLAAIEEYTGHGKGEAQQRGENAGETGDFHIYHL